MACFHSPNAVSTHIRYHTVFELLLLLDVTPGSFSTASLDMLAWFLNRQLHYDEVNMQTYCWNCSLIHLSNIQIPIYQLKSQLIWSIEKSTACMSTLRVLLLSFGAHRRRSINTALNNCNPFGIKFMALTFHHASCRWKLPAVHVGILHRKHHAHPVSHCVTVIVLRHQQENFCIPVCEHISQQANSC